VPGLIDAVREIGLGRHDSPGHSAAACELVLEALVAQKRLTRKENGSYTRVTRRPRPPKGNPEGPFGPPTFDV